MYFCPQDDFDLTRIAESGQCFRWEAQEDGGYRIPFRNSCLYIRDKWRVSRCRKEELMTSFYVPIGTSSQPSAPTIVCPRSC